MTANAGPRKPDTSLRKPTRKIVYWFLVVLVTMALVPLGAVAYKLIDIGREALITSQQEVQLQVAASTVRQLNAAIDGVREQMARLAESLAQCRVRMASARQVLAARSERNGDGGFID